MMDKKLIEKYLKLYPQIDMEIKRVENDLEFYEKKKTEYKSNNQHGNRDEIIKKISDGLKQKHDQILELMNIKEYISLALMRTDSKCRKIIELRLWEMQSWDEISIAMGVSRRQTERIYQQFFSYFEKFNTTLLILDIQ